MNHSEAIQSNAALAYLVGNLSEAERNAFEYHFIDCPVCAKAVWTATATDVPYPEVVKSRPGKVIRFPVRWIAERAVAAVLVIVVGIQGSMLYLQRLQPLPLMQIATSGPHLTGTMRAGSSEKVVHFQGDQPVDVTIDIPPEPPYPSYRLELRDSSGKTLSAVNAGGEQIRNEQGEPFHFLLRPLPAGRYVLVVEGVQKDGNLLPIIRPGIVVQ